MIFNKVNLLLDLILDLQHINLDDDLSKSKLRLWRVILNIIEFVQSNFNNREISLGLWFIVFLVWVLSQKKISGSIFSLIKIIFSKALLRINLLMLLYLSVILLLLYRINFWRFSLLKDTIYWISGVAFIMLMNASKAYTEPYFFKKTLLDNLKFVLILEFVVNFYSYNLIWELILLPFVVLLVGMNVVSELEKDHLVVKKMTTAILSIIGIIYTIGAIYQVFSNLTDFLLYDNLRSLLFPAIMICFYLPFIYLIALFMQYETLFSRISIRISENKKLLRFVKFQVFKCSHFNLKKLTRFAKSVPVYNFYSREDILDYVQKFNNGYYES
jgi:hypothetical protein